MVGYYKNPDATEQAFDADGFLRTGDVGYFDELNQLYVVDRVKELIKYKGFQVRVKVEQTKISFLHWLVYPSFSLGWRYDADGNHVHAVNLIELG